MTPVLSIKVVPAQPGDPSIMAHMALQLGTVIFVLKKHRKVEQRLGSCRSLLVITLRAKDQLGGV